MMALLALMVFGAIGFLLATAVNLEHSVYKRASKRSAAIPLKKCCGRRSDFLRWQLP
jgi:hypothetical protein